MDIILEPHNIQDTIQRPHEAQEGGKSVMLRSFLEGGRKYSRCWGFDLCTHWAALVLLSITLIRSSCRASPWRQRSAESKDNEPTTAVSSPLSWWMWSCSSLWLSCTLPTWQTLNFWVFISIKIVIYSWFEQKNWIAYNSKRTCLLYWEWLLRGMEPGRSGRLCGQIW